MQSITPKYSVNSDPFRSSHSRWLALTDRTPSSHSSFLYGVKSTKIYCRPTCTARLARRANVVYYDTEDQARRDGFRPCKRCKPDDPTFLGDSEEVVSRTIALLRIKKDDVTMKRSLKELAKEVGVTPSYLCRVFKKVIGMTLGAYMKEFEKEASEGENESSVLSLGETGPDLVDTETGLLTPATTTRSLSPPAEDREVWLAKDGMENVEEFFDLDFNMDEWLCTEDFPNDSMLSLLGEAGNSPPTVGLGDFLTCRTSSHD